MAKLKFPLQSFSASGAISKVLTFRRSNSQNIVSGYAKPNDYRRVPVSVEQTTQRLKYSAGVDAWNALTPEQKEDYVISALPLHLTGFNLFMREYLNTPVIITYRLLETGDIRLLETGDSLLLEQ